MNLQFYLEKLENSEEYKKFIRENSDAFFCSGFFTIDETGKEKDQQHLDYFIPSSNKMFSFQLGENINLAPIENFGKDFTPSPLKNIVLDFDRIKEIVLEEMEKNKIKNKIKKILLSLQNKGEKNFLIGTIFISGLGLLKIKIDLNENKIIEFEKKSFFDMMKIIKK